MLLLDEPAAHLDVGHQLQLFRVLDEVRRRGVAVLAVVHDLQRAAAWARAWRSSSGAGSSPRARPRTVLGGAAASGAFGVAIRACRSASGRRLWRFEERPPA